MRDASPKQKGTPVGDEATGGSGAASGFELTAIRGRRGLLRVVVSVVLVSAIAGQAADAAAQVQAAAVARIRLLNLQAMDDYDGLEFDSARDKLLEALSVAESASVTEGQDLARVYVSLGVVHGAGFNNRTKAIEAFAKGLQIDRSIRLDPVRATPELVEMFSSASASVVTSAPEPAVVIRHVPLTHGLQERRVVVRAGVTESREVGAVVLFYRSRRSSPFARARMHAHGSTVYTATIPGRRVRPPNLEYYIEVRSHEGEVLAQAGSRTSPIMVEVRRRRERARPTPRTLSVAVMVGTGGGIVFGGESEHLHPRVSGPLGVVNIKPGAAPSPLHLAAEVSYHLTRLWRLSVLSRIQLLTLLDGVSITAPNPVSFLGLARAKRYFGIGTAQPYLSFGAGGGQLRHRISLGNYDPTEDPSGTITPNDIVDARLAGYGVLAFGGGLDVMFSRHLGLAVDMTGMILIPEFAAHLDLNLGFVISF